MREPGKRILIGILCIVLTAVGVYLLVHARTRKQEQAGTSATAAPTAQATQGPTATAADPNASPTPTPSPTPTAEPTPIADPDTIVPGDRGILVACVQARLKALGYYYYKPTGYFAGVTQTALTRFQTTNNITADGIASKETLALLFSADAKRAPMTATASPQPTPPTVRPREYGEALRWSEVDALLPVNSEFLIVDLNSQKYFTAVRTGGTNHMEIVPKDTAEREKYEEIFSGQTAFTKRPCVIELDGQRYLAASLCGAPHGIATGNSGLSGTLCLYFFESTAHDSALHDAEHDANLLVASNGATPAPASTATP